MLTKAIRGTKDILPDEVYKWQYLEKRFSRLCKKYGFREIRTPIFENTNLFARGVGEETDIVNKEMYTFEDRGGRSLTLKPEGTSPVVRALIEHKEYAAGKPVKYYYITPCFRYEKPQAGRLREFHQFGVEVFGAEGMLADAEVISMADDFIKEMGLDDVELRINSIGCKKCRPDYRQALKDYFRPHLEELCPDCRKRFDNNPMRIIDCKNKVCKEIAKDAPVMLDYLCDDCKKAFEDLKDNLDYFGIEYKVDPSIVRGLDYYSKTAFEFVTEKIGAQGTVCGGGRYDDLVEEIGGPKTPGVGFGMGIERLLLLIEASGKTLGDEERPHALFIPMGDEAKKLVLMMAKDYRDRGLSIRLDDMERGLKAQMKYADRLGVRYTVIIGEDEIKKELASVKNMDTGDQEEIAFRDLFDVLEEACLK
jgi:histidyl-tRNA synthetase